MATAMATMATMAIRAAAHRAAGGGRLLSLLPCPGGRPFATVPRTGSRRPDKPSPDRRVPPEMDARTESSSSSSAAVAKGFLRPQKSYTPPAELAEKFKNICTAVVGTDDADLSDISNKYALLTACHKEFEHAVPNSLLHAMETTSDVLDFYKIKVDTSVPLDMMKTIELPKNLHIQYEYHRFHPDTDTMFNGVTAFPHSSTLVTGLKYKGKYAGHTQESEWSNFKQ